MKRTTLLLFVTIFLGRVSVQSIERPDWAGFYSEVRNTPIDTKKFPFIKGEADRIKWSNVETKEGVFDWTRMDTHIRNAVKGKYYYYFFLWTGPDSPEWIYEKGVPKVVTLGNKKRDYYPFYLDPTYISYFHRFIAKPQ